MAKKGRKEGTNGAESGKPCRRYENYSSCQYLAHSTKRSVRLEFLGTCEETRFGNLEEWKSFLESQKCEVYTAEDGESAVSCCLQVQPDLVLLQDSLPDIRNFELCRRLKKDPLNQLTPIVLLKPSPNQWDIQRGH